MPASTLIRSPLRELAHRVADGIDTTLYWNERTGAVTVSVRDIRSGEHMQFAVAPDKALRAFYHPYACAPVSPASGPTPPGRSLQD